MTNAEYKEFAKKVLEEIAGIEFENESNITNISELFFLKIREAIIRWKNKKISVFNEFEVLTKALSNDDNTTGDSQNSISLNTYTTLKDNHFCKLVRFRAYQFLIEDFPNIENILFKLGIENYNEFITKVKSIDAITCEDDWEVVNITIDCFEKEENELTSYFSGLFTYYHFRQLVLFIIDITNKDVFLLFSKQVKYLGEHYFSTYKERMIIYKDIINSNSIFFSQHYQALIRILSKKFSTYYANYKLNTMRELQKKYEEDLPNDMPDDYFVSPALILDIMFMGYFILYHFPILVPGVFWLLESDKIPLNLKQSLRESLKKSDYAPLIQYEHNWYLKQSENTEELFKDVFYSGDFVDLNTFGIGDYDLSNWKHLLGPAEENSLIQEDTQKGTNLLIFQQSYEILSWIDHSLYPYYVLFEKDALSEKGHTFRKIYLAPLFSYASTIKDDYTLYGFAYLIYKSQFFNWGRQCFDKELVMVIKHLFKINSPNTKEYNKYKAELKAYQIIEESEHIPRTLLADKDIELLELKFRKKKRS
jgi:hypothetical protein